MIKAILFCNCANRNDPMYGVNGHVHHALEKMAANKISFKVFDGYMNAVTQKQFISECEDADLVIMDAWNHSDNMQSIEEAQESMAEIARGIKNINPNIVMFADLMEGVYEVAVHQYAKPLPHWTDREALGPAMRYLAARDRNNERRRAISAIALPVFP